MKNEITWATNAKGLGIIFVVLGHVLRGLNNANIYTNNSFKVIDYVIYTFHMPLFFFLSGLFILKSLDKRNYKQFALLKIKQLFYLYIIWSLLQFFIQLMFSNSINGSVNYYDIFHLFYLPKGQMWFVYVLLFFLLTLGFVFKQIKSKNKRLIILSVLIVVASLLREFGFSSNFVLDKIAVNFLFIVLGILYSLVNIKVSKKYFIITFLIFGGVLYFNIINNTLNYDNQFLSAIFGVLSVILLCRFSSTKFLAKFGDVSLEIYLSHIIFASGIRIVLHKIFLIENIFVHVLVGLFVGLVFPLLLLKLINKIQFGFFLFKNPMK